MILDVVFEEIEQEMTVDEIEQEMTVDFGEITRVGTVEIPKEYGLITYDQNKVITVS